MVNDVMEEIVDLLKSEPFIIEESITKDSNIKMLPVWDSLKQLIFLVEVEKKFKIEIFPEEVASIITIGDLIKKIEEKQILG